MSKILVVEDCEDLRAVLTLHLETKGYSVITAEDGEKGVLAAKAEHPDLIVMDLNMPVLDGFASTKVLKSSEDTKAIPIIALSVLATADNKDAEYEAGCDAYLTKPIDFELFFKTLDTLLSKS